MGLRIKFCPICGSAPIIDKNPLWKDCGNTSHGYRGWYEYNIKCYNSDCPMALVKITRSVSSNSIEDYDIKDHIVTSWNEYCDKVDEMLKSKGIE